METAPKAPDIAATLQGLARGLASYAEQLQILAKELELSVVQKEKKGKANES